MATFSVNSITEESKRFFKKDTWYKGKNGTTEQGITVKCSDNLESNTGWWSGTFVENFFRLATPNLWEEVTCTEEVNKLEKKLSEFKEKALNY